jgi:co-chaperonin GroES (HSP10)
MDKIKALKPRNGLILIRRDPPREATEAGIVLPTDPDQGKFILATILALGPGLIDVAQRVGLDDLEIGMRVVIKANNPEGRRPGAIPGTVEPQKNPLTLPFKVDGEDVELINQHDILAIIEEEQDDG